MYPMDLYGDCKCPMSSRKGQVIKKGFFLGGGIRRVLPESGDQSRIRVQHQFLSGDRAGLDLACPEGGPSHQVCAYNMMSTSFTHGAFPLQQQSRPLWVYPYLQLMTYFED